MTEKSTIKGYFSKTILGTSKLKIVIFYTLINLKSSIKSALMENKA